MTLSLLPLILLTAAPVKLRLVTGGAKLSSVGLPLVRLDLHAKANDAELVALVLQGQRTAARALYDRHVARVTLRAARLLRSQFEAEDVVQDSFLEAFRDLSKLRQTDKFASWLDRIMAHQVTRRFRKRRTLELLGLSVILGANTSPTTHVDDRCSLDQFAAPDSDPEQLAQLKQLDRLLNTIPEQERIVWMLRRIDGLNHSEICEQCSCSLATAKRRIARVDQALSAHFSFIRNNEEAHHEDA